MSVHSFKINILLLVCLAVVSCRDKTASESEQPIPAPQVKAEIVRGPLSFRITTDQEELTISDQLILTMSAEAPEDFSFQFPKFGEGMEQFAIVDYKTETPRLNDQKNMQYARTYILEPLFAETYEIPAVKVTFRENGEEGKTHELETEPFSVTVKLPPPEFWEKLDIDSETSLEPADSLHSKQQRKQLCYALGAAAGILLLAGLVLYFRRRRQQIETIPQVPPHVKAFAALQELIDEDLIKKNELKLFYLCISSILRFYIEEQFHIHAPELTTQEFLEILTQDQSLLKKHQVLLQNFLTHCDMVKFAEHQPGSLEIQQTFDACKAFISQTAQT